MTVRLVSLSFASLHPDELAPFWAHALGSHAESDSGDVVLVPDDGTGFHLIFTPTTVPKTGQNRIHFDLTTASLDDQTNTVASLLARGGRHVDIGQTPDEDHVVLADPEGNELCVLAPGSNFLAGCPRLGAVNCDGTHELGVFWSQALGWPLVWDHGEETAIQHPSGNGPKVTWSGTPLMPRWGHERLHFHVEPSPGLTAEAAAEPLLAIGARRLADDAACPGAHAFADADGNAYCLLAP